MTIRLPVPRAVVVRLAELRETRLAADAEARGILAGLLAGHGIEEREVLGIDDGPEPAILLRPITYGAEEASMSDEKPAHPNRGRSAEARDPNRPIDPETGEKEGLGPREGQEGAEVVEGDGGGGALPEAEADEGQPV